MRVTFVRPSMDGRRAGDAMTPLAFAYLAALTPPDVELALYDERLETVPLDEPTDLVALTVETYTARRSYQLAHAFRARGAPVVMGGYHPTFLPHEALGYADAVAIGDGEGTWPEIIADARRGRLRPIYGERETRPPLAVTPDRSIFAGKRYAPIGLAQYGRGCRFACDFCSIHAFYGRDLRQRPLGEFVRDVAALGTRDVFIVDDNLFVDDAQAERLFRALAPLRVRWSCQISIDVTRNVRLLELMRESGCSSVLIGFESLDRGSLAQMKKGWNLRHHDYEVSIARVKDAGLMIYGTFVHGYDHDTVASCERNLEFALRHRFFLANFNPLTPTPATGLYDRLRREGRLIRDPWWLDGRYRYGQAAFHPRGMTAGELEAGCYAARSRFNTIANIARRATDTRTNLRSPHALGRFLLANAISRAEIHRKQGAPLGLPDAPLPPPRRAPGEVAAGDAPRGLELAR